MKSHWAMYREELGSAEVFIEREFGFIAYEILTDCIYLTELYILPEFRGSGRAKELLAEVEQVAIKLGLKMLISNVNMTIKPEVAANSIQGHIALNFLPFRAVDNKLWFKRMIGGNDE